MGGLKRLAIAIALTGCGAVPPDTGRFDQGPSGALSEAELRAEPVRFDLDLPYSDDDHPRRRLDLYLPDEPEPSVMAVGGGPMNLMASVGGMWRMLTRPVYWLCRSVMRKRRRVAANAVVAQVVRVGVQSIFIVTLVCAAVGFILALQMAPPLDELGRIDLVPNIIAVAVFRELGPLIAAIVLIGFAGASIAAEIGAMVVGEEVEALEVHGLNPIRFLVAPRLMATTVSLTALAVMADFVAVAAGLMLGVLVLDIPYQTYIDNTLAQIGPIDFLTGLIKAGVFGSLIGLIACYNGLRVHGGASGVGQATTRTVVQSIVAVIFADLAFTSVFYALGLV